MRMLEIEQGIEQNRRTRRRKRTEKGAPSPIRYPAFTVIPEVQYEGGGGWGGSYH
jgi:hypothetical protein